MGACRQGALIDRQVQCPAHAFVQSRVILADLRHFPLWNLYARLILAPSRLGRFPVLNRAAERHGQHAIGLIGLRPHVLFARIDAAHAILGAIQPLGQSPWQVIDDIRLPTLEQSEPGSRVFDGQNLHRLGLRFVPVGIVGPKIFPPLKHDPVASIPFLNDIGTTASGIFQISFGALQEALRIAVPVEVIPIAAQVPHERWLRPLGFDEYFGRADHLYRVDKLIGLGAVP